MGLDNGIVLNAKQEIKIPFWVKIDFYNNLNRDAAEVCYWRKCWGIRDTILNHLENGRDNDTYEFNLSSKDVKNIRKIVQYFISKKRWDRESRSIWEWEDMKWRLLQQWINLHWLERYMQKNDVEVIFYDSY